jgi:uncharacterized membrane protein
MSDQSLVPDQEAQDRKRNTYIVIAVVVVVLLCCCLVAVGAWYFGDQLLELVGLQI